MPEIEEAVVQVSTPRARTDADVWADILKLQLDGVMMHIALFEECTMHDMCGCGYLHKHHSAEEFENYIHVLGDYLELYKKAPSLNNFSQPTVKLDGATAEEKMMKCMELYENWEKDVCSKLKKYKNELTEGEEYVDELIYKVHQEMKCINLMINDLYDGKAEELNEWLIQKYKG